MADALFNLYYPSLQALLAQTENKVILCCWCPPATLPLPLAHLTCSSAARANSNKCHTLLLVSTCLPLPHVTFAGAACVGRDWLLTRQWQPLLFFTSGCVTGVIGCSLSSLATSSWPFAANHQAVPAMPSETSFCLAHRWAPQRVSPSSGSTSGRRLRHRRPMADGTQLHLVAGA